MDVSEIEVDVGLVEIVDTGVADRRQNATEVGVARKKRGLDQRRVGDGIGHCRGFGRRSGALDHHADEFGRSLAITHNRLGKLKSDLDDRRL